MAELVDAPDLGSGAARCESSSLSFRTIYLLTITVNLGLSQVVRQRVLIPSFLVRIQVDLPYTISDSPIIWPITKLVAEVAELVDALDLGSGAARCESSSLSFRTIKC